MHRPEALMERVEQWQEQDLRIFSLPAYSPGPDEVETLWKKSGTNGSDLRLSCTGRPASNTSLIKSTKNI